MDLPVEAESGRRSIRGNRDDFERQRRRIKRERAFERGTRSAELGVGSS